MIRSRFLLILAAVMFTLLVLNDARAGQPTEQLKPAIDRVIRTLEDPALKGEAKTGERRRALQHIASEVFDWTEMAKRALGRHWRGRTEAEREEFVKLFRDLLERSYISTIERYGGEKITYAGDSVDGDQATIKTKFATKNGREVAIDYRMIRRDGRWLAYDVVVENVGLVSNFRAQFDQIIQTSSYHELVKKMKNQEFTKKAS